MKNIINNNGIKFIVTLLIAATAYTVAARNGMVQSVGLPSVFTHTRNGMLREIPVRKCGPLAALKLQGILTGARPLAIINGASFAVGETIQIRLTDRDVTVTCEQITFDTVRIVEGGKAHTFHLTH